MNSGHKIMTVFLTVLCALLLTLVGLCADWPLWAWPTAGCVLIGCAFLGAHLSAPREAMIPQENLVEPEVPTAQKQEQRITNVALQSAIKDYDFLLSARVRWAVLGEYDEDPPFDPAALAVRAVLLRAQEIASRFEPHRSTYAQHQLNGALGSLEPDPSGRVLAMAGSVGLTLADVDEERLSRLSNVRKDEAVWEHQRDYERNKRSYLSDDALKDPGSAVVWWLAKNDDRVEHVVERIPLLAELSAAANNTDVPDRFRGREDFAELKSDADDVRAAEEYGPSDADKVAEALRKFLGLDADTTDLDLVGARVSDVLRAGGWEEQAADFLAAFVPPSAEEHTVEGKNPREEPEEDPADG